MSHLESQIKADMNEVYLEKAKKQFWANVKKGNDLDGCWEWQKGCTDKGYGAFRYFGKQTYAHRMAWIITYGAIPHNMFVLHRCDNRKCVNPNHLFLGTHNDNMKDMASKGRASRHQGKLSESQVDEIRTEYKNGIKKRVALKKLSCKYGVNPSTVWRAGKKKTWRNANG